MSVLVSCDCFELSQEHNDKAEPSRHPHGSSSLEVDQFKIVVTEGQNGFPLSSVDHRYLLIVIFKSGLLWALPPRVVQQAF